MTDNALAEIVAVEKEIQVRLAEERRKAEAWLSEEREKITREVEEKLAADRQDFRQAIAEAEAEAGIEVASLTRAAEEYAERLRALPDERLRELVSAHLHQLLPGEKP